MLKLKKAERARFIQRQIATAFNHQDVDMQMAEETEDDSFEDSYGSEGNLVLADTNISSSSSRSDENTGDSFDVRDIFTITRSGRIATNWKGSG